MSASAMELGTPRGNDTTTGSYSELFGATFTRIEELDLVDETLPWIFRFPPKLLLCSSESSLSEDDDEELEKLILTTVSNNQADQS